MKALTDDYDGPHQVVVRRNPTNLGIGAHVNAVMQATQGALIVLMAGDDISLSNRVACVAQAWDDSDQKLDLIASHVHDMSLDGDDLGILRVDDLARWRSVEDWCRKRPYIVGAAHAVTRRLFDHFGPFAPQLAYEDQADTLRAICLGGACTLDIPLVRYRRGGITHELKHEFSDKRYIEKLKRENALHIAMHEQWLMDAKVAGSIDIVHKAIHVEYQRSLFVRAALDKTSKIARFILAIKPSILPMGWRLRRTIYLTWPRWAASIRTIQTKLKALRARRKRL
jgi:hypothetical protein